MEESIRFIISSPNCTVSDKTTLILYVPFIFKDLYDCIGLVRMWFVMSYTKLEKVLLKNNQKDHNVERNSLLTLPKTVCRIWKLSLEVFRHGLDKGH